MSQVNEQDQMVLHHPLNEYKNIYKDLHNNMLAKKIDSLINNSL